MSQCVVSGESSSLIHHGTFLDYLFYGIDSLTSYRLIMWTDQLTQCFQPLQKIRRGRCLLTCFKLSNN